MHNAASGLEVDPTIFRGYDVRGYVRDVNAGKRVLRQNLTPDVAEAFGRALGSMLEVGNTVAVTSDHRTLSLELVQGLTHGFTAVGVHVLHNENQPLYGGKPYLPTGALTWFLLKSGVQGSVQVTGSHNPPEFNGFKIALKGEALFGDALQALLPVIREGRFRPEVSASERGSVRKVDMLGQYLSMLEHSFPGKFNVPRRVVIDSGNGLGRVLAPILKTKGCEVLEMFPEPDPNFSNHPADPSSEDGTRALRERIMGLNHKLAAGELPWIGIALDGDSDRSGFVDERGQPVWPERMAAIFYRDYLEQPGHRGHVLALDVRGSNVVRDAVETAGGKGAFIPAGYPYHRRFARAVVPEIGKTAVGVSAEASGHFFFPSAALDENGKRVPNGDATLIDDGIFSAVCFLVILDKKRAQVTELMGSLPTYCTSNELRLFAPDEIKAAIVQAIRSELIERYRLPSDTRTVMADGMPIQEARAAVIEVDGIRLQFPDGAWLVVRMSNTSPNLVVKFEAPERRRALELMATVRELLARFPEVDAKALVDEMNSLANN